MGYRMTFEAELLQSTGLAVEWSWRPPPKLSIAQWAEENLRLSAEDSAEAGAYRTARAPYQRGILDAINDPTCDQVVVMSSAQVGKTLLAKAVIGYYIDQDPSPILFVTYSLDMAETFSKDRLAPMVRDTECLRGKIADPRARDSGNTILHKRFPGGHVTMVGANAPGGLASRPVRVVICDEVDRYPASAGTEGDPVTLAFARAKTFWNRRLLLFSTPGDEATSRINPAYEASDKRRFHVPCPHCGHLQHLRWQQVSWTNDDPATTGYACEQCGALWTDAERVDSLQAGIWVAEHPERRIAGFHLNELYSPFRKLSEIVADFISAKKAPETLKTWVNTSLGEVWRDEEGEKADADSLAARCESYQKVPDGAVIITMAVDVQDDRLEMEFVGWGAGEESWGIDHVVLRGNPGQQELWDRADDHLGRTFEREDGAVLAVSGCVIDSAGHYTRQVYAWARKHRGRVYAIVGRAGKGRPLVMAGKKVIKDFGIKLFTVGVDTAKELLLMSRVKIREPGPGYCHWPRSYPADYFDQLTSERRVVRYSRGHPTHVWELVKGKRNEALDMRVYAMALIALLRPNFEALASRLMPGAKPLPQTSAIQRRGNRSSGVSLY
jgi:phage terminase large subunit GpA-like protein